MRPSPAGILGTSLLGLLTAAPAVAAPLGEHASLELLIQPLLALDEQEGSATTPLAVEPQLGRVAFALSGEPAERLCFFAQLGAEGLGSQGDWTTPLGLWDAWLEWNVGPRMQLDVGLMPPPWAIHAMQRDGTRLDIDAHRELLPYPTGATGRDVGVQVRGRILDQRLEYRLAGLAGIDAGQGLAATDYDHDGSPDAPALNPDDMPRVTARLAWSFFDPQGAAGLEGFHSRGVVLDHTQGVRSSRKVLTFGVAVDHQPDALYVEHRDYTGSVASATRADYTALTADLLADLPLAGGDRSLNVLLAGFRYLLDEAHPAAGRGLLATAGYRVGRWQPLGSYEFIDADASSAYDRVSARLGLATWLDQPGTRLRIEAGAARQGGGNDLLFEGRLQAQLMF